MAAFQKISHLRVERIAINGTYITPVEAPPELPEEADLADVANAYEDLRERLIEAGILTAPQAPEDEDEDEDGQTAN